MIKVEVLNNQLNARFRECLIIVEKFYNKVRASVTIPFI